MERVRQITHKDKAIIFTDMSGLASSEEQIAVLKYSQELVCSQQRGTVRSLIDYTGLHYNMAGVEAQKQFSAAVGPYLKASAVVGITGMLQVIYRSIVKLTGRNIKCFEDAETAKDWLAEA